MLDPCSHGLIRNPEELCQVDAFRRRELGLSFMKFCLSMWNGFVGFIHGKRLDVLGGYPHPQEDSNRDHFFHDPHPFLSINTLGTIGNSLVHRLSLG